MKSVSISGSIRQNVGKKDAKLLRKEGLIPSVLYGGKEQLTLKIDEKEISKLINRPDVYTIKLVVDGKEFNCVIKEKQFHPVTDRVLHVDFLEVFTDKPAIMEIPIKVEGTAPGILTGGRLIAKIRRLKVKGIYTDLPDYITMDISKLKLGDSIKVGQLSYPGVEFLDRANSVVVMVKLTRGAISAAQEEEEAAEAAAEAAAGENTDTPSEASN